MVVLKNLTFGVAVAAVLAGVGVGVACRPAPVTDPPADWKAEFRKAYGLADGQVVRQIPRPFPRVREQFGFANKLQRQPQTDPPKPIGNEIALILNWQGDRPNIRGMMGSAPDDPNYTNDLHLDYVTQIVTGVHPHQIETTGPRHRDRRQLNQTPVPGDFVFDPAAPLADRVAALDRILRDECKLPVRVRLETVVRPVLVAEGRYYPKPRPGREAGHIDVFGHKPPGGRPIEYSGDMAEFLADLSGWMGMRVVDAVEGPRPAKLRWSQHLREGGESIDCDDFHWRSDEADHDWRMVSWTVADQTGLRFRLEDRPVEVVRIEPVK
jgi:hypothetical protein